MEFIRSKCPIVSREKTQLHTWKRDPSMGWDMHSKPFHVSWMRRLSATVRLSHAGVDLGMDSVLYEDRAPFDSIMEVASRVYPDVMTRYRIRPDSTLEARIVVEARDFPVLQMSDVDLDALQLTQSEIDVVMQEQQRMERESQGVRIHALIPKRWGSRLLNLGKGMSESGPIYRIEPLRAREIGASDIWSSKSEDPFSVEAALLRARSTFSDPSNEAKA